MAIFTPGALVAEVRGSVGSRTFSKNAFGPYVKRKSNPGNLDTEFQQVRRAAITEGVAAWQALSNERFLEWQAFVQSVKHSNSLGVQIARTAYNEFLSRYVNRSVIESSLTDFDPYPVALRYPWLVGVSAGEESIQVSWQSLYNPSNTEIVIYASAPMSPGKRSLNVNWLRVVDHFAVSELSGTREIYTTYVARFNPTSADNGKRIFFAVAAVNTQNFAASKKAFFDLQVGNIFPGTPGIFDSTFDETFD